MEEDEDGPDFTGPALTEDLAPTDSPERPRRLRSHGSFLEHETKIAIIGRPNVGKSTLLNALTGTNRAIVSSIAGTTRDAVDEVVTRANHDFRFVDTAGIRRKGKTHLMAEKLSVIMARKHLEAADVSLLILDATEGVTALDANIGGYAHESGRSVIIVVNKWDLIAHPATNSPATNSNPNTNRAGQSSTSNQQLATSNSAQPADPKIYEQQVGDHLKFLDYAPIVFLSATSGRGIEGLFKKVELVARERRKRVTTGQMNRFLARVDFQRASVPMNRRVKIYYMTQAAVAPPTFVLFTDKDVKLHFAFERFLANQIRAAFGFIGTPIWFKSRPRNKKTIQD
jgi:GTP-binding protein